MKMFATVTKEQKQLAHRVNRIFKGLEGKDSLPALSVVVAAHIHALDDNEGIRRAAIERFAYQVAKHLNLVFL